MMWTARIIVCLPQGGLDLAITYLTLRAGLKSKDALVQKKGLQDWFAETAETERQKWCTNPPSKKGKAAMKEAEKTVAEWALHEWVRKQNMEKGIAPLSGIVWSQREKNLNADAAAGVVPRPRPTKQKERLQWLRRWRLRWRIKLGAIQAREHVPADECQSKAKRQQFNHYLVNKRTQKMNCPMTALKKEGPECGPFCGAA
jgi:hypothetical protein